LRARLQQQPLLAQFAGEVGDARVRNAPMARSGLRFIRYTIASRAATCARAAPSRR